MAVQSSSDEAENRSEEPYNYDDILEHLGQMGKFQIRFCLLLCIPGFFPGIVVMSSNFTTALPQYRCLMEDCGNTTQPKGIWSSNVNLESKQENGCYRYNRKDPQLKCQPLYVEDVVDPSLLEKCESWAYENSIFESTMATEFNLTCENEWKQTLVNTLYMVGMFVGAIVLGNAADIIGRKMAFTLNCFAMACSMTASAFAPDLLTFSILRFFCGVTGVAHFLIIFVWGVEAVGKKYRTQVGFLYSIVFSLGSASLGLTAYFIRDWRTLQLVVSLPIFIPVLLFWTLPESIRWLITKKRFEEARELIIQVAKTNGKRVPDHLLIKPIDDDIWVNQKCQSSTIVHGQVADRSDPSGKNEMPDNIVGIFRTPVLCRRLFVMFAAWVAAVMSYYGITYATANLSGDFFINFQLSMLIEIPASVFGIYFMNLVGRRAAICSSLLICGLACLATGLAPAEPAMLQVIFSLVGKFCNSFILGSVYTYTSELFPTNSRSAAIGLCSTAGRIGGVLAPVVADLGRKGSPTLPFFVFAIVNTIVGFLCLVLPETNNKPLPSTIQEALDLPGPRWHCSPCRKRDSKNFTTPTA